MDTANIKAIAKNFPEEYQEFEICVNLPLAEFAIFEEGVVAEDMDHKWHIYVSENNLYWIRSWTGFCIYKAPFKKTEDDVELKRVLVNRNKDQYTSTDIEFDKILFLELLQAYLGREDIYVDPRFENKIIKDIVARIDTENNYIKSIGTQEYGLTLSILESIRDMDVFEGLDELKSNAKNIALKEDLVSLYYQNRNNNKDSGTYYFDKDVTRLLGHIKTKK
ncbi:MAG: hypothetical protein IT271_11905 [Chitinophagales bacterium]|nr:hypothetical protein [Chitinophagales bacterium]